MATTTWDARPFVPDSADLDELRKAAGGCKGCDLYEAATQTVFGAGPRTARVLMLGEQPGDQEDKAGAPFVGPAGRVLDRALEELGVDRDQVYVTNAVKHFKFVPAERGKRRIHKTPSRTEVVACRPWLLAELRLVRPEFVVLLGAVAAKAVMGPSFKLTEHRGKMFDLPAELDNEPLPPARALATVHPSSVLRAPDRDEAYRAFAADLKPLASL
ncbi:MAG TPA: UdgX family uracil-DNA binding protein [Actinophytocola sp.]|uniref:UdgX family uracil-DNA binding protein n=1 Tax=Actinophytocola sp. TaxID=1872138 RepID=UPI002DDDBC6E|nr:UdgX family uracil-DNA binding protein [Actinophytocola sp.]HEV2784149.1 UdgX family uracil-DNA binding protein [Actinophytocola sp.]